jgi:hypothetical protein
MGGRKGDAETFGYMDTLLRCRICGVIEALYRPPPGAYERKITRAFVRS